jgi:hypothetical protein
MAMEHWSDDDLIRRLYDVGPENAAHLEECSDCGERWRQLRERRRAMLPDGHVPADLLARQRAAIRERLAAPRRIATLAPAAAALFLVIAALLLSGPEPGPQPTRASSDAQFFAEIHSIARSAMPRTATPIRALFEE